VAESFVIEGGRPLRGTVRAAGNKNAALPILAGCLLTDEPVHLANVPRIRDVETILSHATHLGLPRDTLLKKALFACDELSGFVHACGLVRPSGLEGLEPKSVRKKLKQPSFAAGVSREDVYEGAELLGLELDEHIANVVEALQPIAGELGLRTQAA
jgi:predicted hydrolase (HD superfamily)